MKDGTIPQIGELLFRARQLIDSGDLSAAHVVLQRFAETSPGHSSVANLLGVIAFHRGQKQDAEHFFREAIALDQANAEAWSSLSVALRELGKFQEAESAARRAVELNDSAGDAWMCLGLSLVAQQRWSEALQVMEGLLARDPNNAVAWRAVGVSEQNLGRMREAGDALWNCLRLAPNDADAALAYGYVLSEDNRVDEAVEVLSGVVQRLPEMIAAWLALGYAYELSNRLDEAERCYRQASRIARNDPAPRLALARVLDVQLSSEAEEILKGLLAENPNNADARGHLATIMLRRGDFERGWLEYEWRWKTSQLPVREFSKPPWSGETLRGRTILLYSEQGLGDTIQFVRYAAVLKGLGATVVVECQPGLMKLLANCSGIDRLVAQDQTLPPFDVHVPMLSVPRILKTTVETTPTDVPYLFADRSLIEQWRIRLKDVRGFRVGVNWQGRPGRGCHLRRDIPKELFVSLSEVPGVRLISLQKSDIELQRPENQTRDAGDTHSAIVELGEFDSEQGAFMDTAAVMMSLDLVITSDTSLPHLAGALGVPVWVALPYVPDWRWLLKRKDSPWYPTMRLFRQKSPDDWAGVFEEIRTELLELIDSRRPSSDLSS